MSPLRSAALRVLVVSWMGILFAPLSASCSQSVDLSVASVEYVWLLGDSARIDAVIEVTTIDSTSAFTAEILYEVDSATVGTTMAPVGPKPKAMCEDQSLPCNRECPQIVIDGVPTNGVCGAVFVYDPAAEKCACAYYAETPGGGFPRPPIAETCTVTVDPGNTVPEFDETNNSMTVSIGASPITKTSWGVIRSLYR
jgi:hypothetical protein